MASSEMLRCVALVRTDVSEELTASFIRVTRIDELGTMLVTANIPRSPSLVILMMEALSSSETAVLTRDTQRKIPEDAILHSHSRENLKSYIIHYYLQHDITETGFYLGLLVETTQLGPIDRATLCLRSGHN
jgi:hypothetical protein